MAEPRTGRKSAGSARASRKGGRAATPAKDAVISVEERKTRLKRAVQDLTREARASVRSQGDFAALLVRGEPVNHRLHFVVLVVLVILALAVGLGIGSGPADVAKAMVVPGIYAALWSFLALTGGEELERVAVDEQGRITRVRSGRDVETRSDFIRVAIPVLVIAVSGWIIVGLIHDIAVPPPPNCDIPSDDPSGACYRLPNIAALINATAHLPTSSAKPGASSPSPAASPSPSPAASPAASPSAAPDAAGGGISYEDAKILERAVRSLQLIATLAFLLGAIWFLRRMLTGRWVAFIRPLHHRPGDE